MRTKDFAQAIRKRLADNPALAEEVSEVAFQASIADQICNARIAAGLTQTELADRIGSQQSVIARLEDADYDSYSVSTLTRIGKALGKEVHVVFKDASYRRPSGRQVLSESIEVPRVRWQLVHGDKSVTIRQATVPFCKDCEQGAAA